MINLGRSILTRLLFLLVFILSLTACKPKPSGPCDSNIAIDSVDPFDAAKAIGICDGLVSATWELPDGTTTTNESFAVGHGILPDFGSSNPVREGAVLLALSSGTARRPVDTSYKPPADPGVEKKYSHGFPQTSNMSFPIAAPGCPMPGEPQDGISLLVTIVAPRGVTGYTFDYKYFTADYPNYICTVGADGAATIVHDRNLTNTNILVDVLQNPVTSQTVSYMICAPSRDQPPCPLGEYGLYGTGFDNHGSTDWNTVTVSAAPGDTIEIRFMIWDSDEGLFDSTILFDNFKWITP